MQAKLEAQLRGLGGGFLPEPMARGTSRPAAWCVKAVAHRPSVPRLRLRLAHALAAAAAAQGAAGLALRWWLAAARPARRRARRCSSAHARPRGRRATAADADYVGRFAPSPTGPLHAGSLVAALASWLDARAHGGRWLVRIEDVDTPRCVPARPTERSCASSARCGLLADDAAGVAIAARPRCYEAGAGAPGRGAASAYPCGCTRKRHRQRAAVGGRAAASPPRRAASTPAPAARGCTAGRARAWRLRRRQRCGAALAIGWHDRRLGAQAQNVTHEVGDFVLRRADGLWAYQLAVVVDDAEQGVTACRARRRPGRQHGAPDPLQRRLGVPHAELPAHAAGARRRRREAVEAERRAGARRCADPLRALRRAAARARPRPPRHGPGVLGGCPAWRVRGLGLRRWSRRWHDAAFVSHKDPP